MFVVGNMNVTEGDNIELHCSHQSGFPASNGSLFFFNGGKAYYNEVKSVLCYTLSCVICILSYLLETITTCCHLLPKILEVGPSI